MRILEENLMVKHLFSNAVDLSNNENVVFTLSVAFGSTYGGQNPTLSAPFDAIYAQ